VGCYHQAVKRDRSNRGATAEVSNKGVTVETNSGATEANKPKPVEQMADGVAEAT
jgi:hypothetical protein